MELLRHCEQTAHLPLVLERLGIATLGALAALPRAAVADRFGPAGLRARELALGRDTPLRPRVPGERVEESLTLPESASGPQLERALALLIDQLLARRDRRGRTVRAAVVPRCWWRAAHGASASCSARRRATRRGCVSR